MLSIWALALVDHGAPVPTRRPSVPVLGLILHLLDWVCSGRRVLCSVCVCLLIRVILGQTLSELRVGRCLLGIDSEWTL